MQKLTLSESAEQRAIKFNLKQHNFNLVLVGQAKVGKSSFVLQCVKQKMAE